VLRDRTDEHDMSALMRAAKAGDAAGVALALADGARVNQTVRPHSALRQILALLAWMQQLPDRDGGWTALHYAVSEGHREVAEILLASGAEPGPVARDGQTPLSLAAGRGDLDLVRILIREGAPVRRPPGLESSRPWRSPAAAALLRHSDEPMVRLLLSEGADANEDPAALISAAMQGDSSITALLLDAGADPDGSLREGVTPLMISAGAGHLGVVRALLAGGADPDRRDERAGWTAAQWAAQSNRTEVVTLLAGAAPAEEDLTDLELVQAAARRDAARVRELLAAGANPDMRSSTGSTVLAGAVYRGDPEVARALLEAGADMDRLSAGEIPLLQRAAQTGPPELVRILLDAGADPHAPGTATYAAGGGDLEVLRMLEEAGADLREHSDQPLRSAASGGHVEVVRHLLQRGAVVDAANPSHVTALGHAVAFRAYDVVRMLLEAGADPRQADPESGWTPLMNAAMAGDSLMIRILLDAGADPGARDQQGKSAADYARGAGNGDVVPLLERRGPREGVRVE